MLFAKHNKFSILNFQFSNTNQPACRDKPCLSGISRPDEGTGNRPACRDKPCLSALAEQASFAGANDSNAGNLAAVRICLRQIVRPWRTGRARLVPTAALKRFGLRRDRRGRCPHRPSVQIRSSRGTRHQASGPPVGTSTCIREQATGNREQTRSVAAIIDRHGHPAPTRHRGRKRNLPGAACNL